MSPGGGVGKQPLVENHSSNMRKYQVKKKANGHLNILSLRMQNGTALTILNSVGSEKYTV